MRNEDNWKTQQIVIWDFLMNDQNIIFGYTPTIKTLRIERFQPIDFDECEKYVYWYTSFYLGNIIYLAKILRALLTNKNGIFH